jgi:SAM-dependent methyltransferase
MEQLGRKTRSVRDAQEFQRTLYDRDVAEHGREAYQEGKLGRRLIAERIALSTKYVQPGFRVLDIGAGDGTIAHALAERGARVTGLDVSERAVALAREVNAHPAIDYHCASGEDFSSTEKFDLIVAFEVLEHVYDAQLLFDRAASLLKPGGLFAISTPNRRSFEWYAAYLLRRLRRRDLEPMFRMDERHVRELDHFELLDMAFRSGFVVREARGVILINRLAARMEQAPWLGELMVRAARFLPELAKDQYVVFQRSES